MYDFKPKKMILMLVALVVATLATDFVIHALLLSGDYGKTPDAWSQAVQNEEYPPMMLAGQILVAIAFGCLYARGFASGQWACALIYGVMMGLVLSASFFVWYALVDVAPGLWWKWLLTSVVQGLILGAIAKLVYGKAPLDPAVAKGYGL